MDEKKEELPKGQDEQQAEIVKEVADEKLDESQLAAIAQDSIDKKEEEAQLEEIVKALGEEKVELYQLAWEVFDVHNKGEVSGEDFAKVLEKVYENETDEDRKQLFKEMDLNNDGNISFLEYLKFMRDAECSEENAEDDMDESLLNAFKIADKNNDGVINIEELQLLIKDLGENLTQEQVKPLLENADKNKDGVISFREFKAMFQN